MVLRRRPSSERGASLTEYAVLVAVIVVAAIPALTFLETRTAGAFQTQAAAIEHDGSSVTPTTSPSTPSTTTTSTTTPAVADLAPVASFSVSCGDLTCTFTDGSSDAEGPISSWAWDFGDGETSTEQHPTHTYAAAGTHPVTLVVTDGRGSQASATASAILNAAPEAAFEHSCTMLSCAFTDLSRDDGGVVAWAWTFPGATSSAPDPTHTFTGPGTHDVTLLVTDAEGLSDTVSVPVSIPAVSVSLAGSGSRAGNSNNRTYTVTASATTSSGQATRGVVVQGTWSNGGGAGECRTGADGTCVVDLAVSGANPGPRTFTVAAVTHWAWDGTVPGPLTVAQPNQ